MRLSNRGFSLVELLVAIVIMAIGMLGVVVFMTQNTRTNVKSERNAREGIVREQAIEEFRSWLIRANPEGSRFDSLWNNVSPGAILHTQKDTVSNIGVKLVLGSKEPNPSAIPLYGKLKVLIISTDNLMNETDTSYTLYSRY